MSNNITAIINIYKRGHILDNQIEAIKNQSIPPKSIMIWNNGNKNIDLTKYKNDAFFKVFDNNYNSGVWSRFIIGFLAETEYICIFDDDTIPGNNWFKNCFTEMEKKEALYGTIGVIFHDSDKYQMIRRYGWDSCNNGNNTISKPVDIVGHSWFFKKKWLTYFTKETPLVNEMFNVGEDIYFSYCLQKYGNIPTLVPPHPNTDLSLFGSIPKTAWEYGTDGNSESYNGKTNFDYAYNFYKNKGFRLLCQRQHANSSNDLNYFTNKIKNMEPFALIRPGDGEFNVLQNNTIQTNDFWIFQKDGKLHYDLTEALHLASNKNCYMGIPCNCCNSIISKYYFSAFNLNPNYTTFANIFVNKNWQNWIEFLKRTQTSFVFIGPYNIESEFHVKKYINLPLYLVNEWDIKGDEYVQSILNEVVKYKNTIFMFAGGPISKILVAKAWSLFPYNIYLDIGSSLDIFMKGSSNREYTLDNSYYSQLECKFDPLLIEI